MTTEATVKRAWWKESSVYQIYPASFKDSNGDGLGDLGGILEKLDYIKSLGIDIVWVCPIYKSPQIDMGYDISDYKDIHEPYGTLEDVEQIIKGCHDRGMKFVMDLVVNHTSSEHMWFKEALKGKDNQYRDFYMWKKPKIVDGQRQPPNNWGCVWGGSAWEYDEPSDEYYLHIFDKSQPDLNWENPLVRTAVHDIIRFWLDKGVDGFRCDVINFISKTPGLPDAKVTRKDYPFQSGSDHFACGPRLHEWLQEIGKILAEYNAFSVGEMPCVKDTNEVLKAVGFDRGELNMIFHFEIVDMDIGPRGRFSAGSWTLPQLKQIVQKWQTFMIHNNGWNATYLENHDQGRSVSRFASDSPTHRPYVSKMFATFLTLQSGTVFIYQGQELGMTNVPKDREIGEYRDLETLNAYNELSELFPDPEECKREQALMMKEIQIKSRDNARTPMQWTNQKYAGFSTAEPWQRVNEAYVDINAQAQVGVKHSTFEYWAEVLRLRKREVNIFVYGDFELVDEGHEAIFAFKRSFGEEKAMVVCNFKEAEIKWDVPGNVAIEEKKILISNYGGVKGVEGGKSVVLRPFEAFAVRI